MIRVTSQWTQSWYDSEHHDIEMLTSENLIQCNDAQWLVAADQPGRPWAAQAACRSWYDSDSAFKFDSVMMSRSDLREHHDSALRPSADVHCFVPTS